MYPRGVPRIITRAKYFEIVAEEEEQLEGEEVEESSYSLETLRDKK